MPTGEASDFSRNAQNVTTASSIFFTISLFLENPFVLLPRPAKAAGATGFGALDRLELFPVRCAGMVYNRTAKFLLQVLHGSGIRFPGREFRNSGSKVSGPIRSGGVVLLPRQSAGNTGGFSCNALLAVRRCPITL